MTQTPASYGALPTPRQRRWQSLERIAFVHFTTNTFTDREWGFGDESPAIFNPTDLDVDQVVHTAADAGFRGLVLTCKHHDGFCLWPSAYTEHSVKNSPWRDGNGDMVRAFADACRVRGVEFGVYLSPWDRNRADYASPAYLAYFRNQLRELLTNYGPVFEVWFDGANGGDGYYGGANETRTIDPKTYYDWENTWAIVRELQPDAAIFSDAGPDIRWVGNEDARAGETCWATINAAPFYPGVSDWAVLNRGDRNGTHWMPPEVNTSIRPGWFYHDYEDDKVKSLEHLSRTFFESEGRGGVFMLNLPPDRRGRLHERDVEVLRAWKGVLDATFARDLATDMAITASNTRGGDQFAPSNVLTADPEMYWATDDEITNPELVLAFSAPVTFNVIEVREYIPLGQRLDGVAVDVWREGAWQECAAATSVGYRRLMLMDEVTTDRVRLRVFGPVCPAISRFGLYLMPLPLSKIGPLS